MSAQPISRKILIQGPDPQLHLQHSDVWLPGLYSRRILVFRLPERSCFESAIHAVEKGLRALVQGTPELGGSAVVVPASERPDGKLWRAIVPSDGLELVIKDCRDTCLSFLELEALGYPLTSFRDQELLPISPEIEPEPQKVCKVQLNLIDGGILLGFCGYHRLMDGNGMNTVMLALGEECRKAALLPLQSELPPRILDTNRDIIKSITGTRTKIVQHDAYTIVPGCWFPVSDLPNDRSTTPASSMTTNNRDNDKSTVHVSLFRLSNTKASALKKIASTLTRVSTHDAVSAILWRTMVFARYRLGRIKASNLEDISSTFTFPHDARKHVGLSKDWVGNCVYFVSASLPLSRILEDPERSLPAMASAIRNSLNRVDKETVGGLFEIWKARVWDVAWTFVLEADEPEVVGITSFYQSELYSDFGPTLGFVRHFTTTDSGAGGGLARSMFVGPKLPGSGGGCDVALSMDQEERKEVENDEFWRSFFTDMTSS